MAKTVRKLVVLYSKVDKKYWVAMKYGNCITGYKTTFPTENEAKDYIKSSPYPFVSHEAKVKSKATV